MRCRNKCALPLLAAAVCLAVPSVTHAWLDSSDPTVLTVTDSQDTDFSYGTAPLSGSWTVIHGTASQISVNGWFATAGLKFDLSAYRGMVVQQAELHLAKADTSPNFALVVATINTDWTEASACWRYRSGSTDWTFPYSDFSTASLGNYGSLVWFAYPTNGDYGTYSSGGKTWMRANLDPSVVQTLVVGDQYGLAVTDPRICYQSNPSGATYTTPVYSREAGSATQPKLLIKFATSPDTTAPGSISNLTASAGQESGEVVLRFLPPMDTRAFGYTVKYSTGSDFNTATTIEQWRVPRPRPVGTPQRVLLQNLTPGTTYNFFIQAYNAAGVVSPVQSVSFTVPTLTTPTLVNGSFVTPTATGKTVRSVSGVLRYWAASEVARVSPTTGYNIGGASNDDYKKANAVWDSAANLISLLACRNEVVAAQLIIEKSGTTLSNISVSVSDLAGPGGNAIPSSTSIELFQEHYISTNYADPAIPLAPPFPTTFSIPDPNHNASGKNQGVWMDIWVPKGVAPGDYTGTVTVNASELSTPVTINLKVHVSGVTIPDYPTFLVDLNGYSAAPGLNQWDFGTDFNKTCLRYFQTSHKHRAMINTLPYRQAGARCLDREPTLTGAGPTLHAADWSTFDNKYGRFFDGTAFSPTNPDIPYYGPGQNTPVTHLYTSFSEYFPMTIMDPTYGWDATGYGGEYWNSMVDYAAKTSHDYTTFFSTMPDVFAGFTEGYKQAVRNVVADWCQHAHDKGWTRTNFETFFNDKYYYYSNGDCKALWLLEECEDADDFRAVGFFNQLYREGQAQSGVTDVPWHFRIDISTRFCQHWGQLTNRVNYQDVDGGSSNWHFPNIKYRNYSYDENKQEQWIWYGLEPSATSGNPDHSRIFLQKWCQGLIGGIVYWDAFGYSSWTSFGNPASPIYSGQNVPGFGEYDGPIFGIRIKMMRQAEQLIELLNLWAGTPGMTKPLVRNSLYAKYGSGTRDYQFNTWNENRLYQVRADLIAQLESTLVSAPANPSPANGAAGVSQSASLSWTCASGDATFNVNLDTVNPPLHNVATDLSTASYTPGSLQSGTTYYWQVTAHNGLGTAAGPVWSFTVAGPPPAPAGPSPNNGQINLPLSTTLSWNSGQAAPGITFDVLLGTTNPPTQTVATGQSAATFAASGLQLSKRYYWQIVARNAYGPTAGPVWSFVTHVLGDVDNDGEVNLADLKLMVAAWNSQGGGAYGNWDPNADLDGNNEVNLADLKILVANWNTAP